MTAALETEHRCPNMKTAYWDTLRILRQLPLRLPSRPVAVRFPLPQPHEGRGWKAKIRDRERTEPPHVTVLFKTQAWRLGLREPIGRRSQRETLDARPDPGNVPDAVTDHLLSDEVFPLIVTAWDRLDPHNPVVSPDAD